MTVIQAVRLKFYTTRSLKRDETAGYIRLVRATEEGDPDTVMRDAEVAELESDRSPMISDTDVRNPVDDFSGAWSRSSLATSQGDFPAGVILALGWGVL